jgi:hypothetical protein
VEVEVMEIVMEVEIVRGRYAGEPYRQQQGRSRGMEVTRDVESGLSTVRQQGTIS